MDNDRTILHTVHGDEGYTEVYWTRSYDDNPGGWHGSIQFLKDGTAAYRSWSSKGRPMMTYLHDGDVLVIETEDMEESFAAAAKISDEDSAAILFDSRNLMPRL